MHPRRYRPSGGSSRFGGVRCYSDRERWGWRRIIGPEAGESPDQRAATAIKAAAPFDSADAARRLPANGRGAESATPRVPSQCASPGSARGRRGTEQDRFFARVRSSAFLRISASMVLRPSSRTRSSRRRTSEALTTPSPALEAATPPSAVSRRQRHNRLAATPRRRATVEMLPPLWWLSSTMRSFCSAVHRRRRGVPVTLSKR